MLLYFSFFPREKQKINQKQHTLSSLPHCARFLVVFYLFCVCFIVVSSKENNHKTNVKQQNTRCLPGGMFVLFCLFVVFWNVVFFVVLSCCFVCVLLGKFTNR